MPFIDVTVSKKLTQEEKVDLSQSIEALVRKIPGKEETESIFVIRDEAFIYRSNLEPVFYLLLRMMGPSPRDAKESFVKAITALAAEKLGITDQHRVCVTITEEYQWGQHGKLNVIENS